MAEAAAIIAQTAVFLPELIAQVAATVAVPVELIAHDVAKDVILDAASIIEIGLVTTQLALYWGYAKDATDDRDAIIDKQIIFMDELEDRKLNVDLPMIICKKDILTDLGLPTIDKCGSVTDMSGLSMSDGEAVIEKSEHLAAESCGGIPTGWSNHEGSLHAAKAGSYVGGLSANAETRRVESMESSRLSLTRAAHSGLKSIYNAGDTLGQYAQGSAVHSGIADLWTSGFNSAGAALGVALGQLSTGTSNNNLNVVNANPGISLTAGIGGGENVA